MWQQHHVAVMLQKRLQTSNVESYCLDILLNQLMGARRGCYALPLHLLIQLHEGI